MKDVILTVKEFLQFQQVAANFGIAFDYSKVKKGNVTISAPSADLERIGY